MNSWVHWVYFGVRGYFDTGVAYCVFALYFGGAHGCGKCCYNFGGGRL